MLVVIRTFALGILIFVTLFILQKWQAYSAFRNAATKLGCGRPPKYPHKDTIWGSDLVKERALAARSGRQMQLYMRHFGILGKTWEENFHRTKVINTMEGINIQHVTTTGFQHYAKISQKDFTPFLGKGIFSQEGAAWRHSRDLIKPIFTRSEISDVNSLDIHVTRFLSMIPSDGTMIDLQVPLHRLFLDISTEFLFGQSTCSLLQPGDSNESMEFVKTFNDALMGVGKRRLAGRLSPLIYYFDKDWRRAYEKVHAWVDAHVRRALAENLSESPGSSDTETGSQKRYILLHEMAKQITDPFELRFQILNVLLPARDSVSILMGNALFHLVRNPHIWSQLRTESISLGDTELTYEVLKSLQLFRYVINETLRLQGPSGKVQRVATCNTVLPSGGGLEGKAPIFVEKGTIIALNIWGLHHDEDIWGTDVMEFRPERWQERRLPWQFVPFLGGARICPAQQQILTHATYLLVRMTKMFARIENRDSCEEYIELTKMTTESRNGIKVAFFAQ
ncbi:Cytochrome P450 [Glarea lozoyensis ATCC 20868]|uniref:Cytochrome P450 n=1 Tax=Glarea lozoyensis (strain ATCC 20868 / MF5171) TaxID=1116229 RepID=S3CNR8_GLAL2|nr:Cytochrome P450 [Glarea lozoyensis ATCC 20868]EPE28162.1 Cytochrome P450 [Glarea lozoyensis ATCC 20868]